MIAENQNFSVLFKAQHGICATDLLSEHLYGCHHSSNVDTGSEGVQRNVILFTRSSHPLTHLLQKLQADQATKIIGFQHSHYASHHGEASTQSHNSPENLQQIQHLHVAGHMLWLIARAYQSVPGFPAGEYALQLTREQTHHHCALVGA